MVTTFVFNNIPGSRAKSLCFLIHSGIAGKISIAALCFQKHLSFVPAKTEAHKFVLSLTNPSGL
jgi:hypothetical protein